MSSPQCTLKVRLSPIPWGTKNEDNLTFFLMCGDREVIETIFYKKENQKEPQVMTVKLHSRFFHVGLIHQRTRVGFPCLIACLVVSSLLCFSGSEAGIWIYNSGRYCPYELMQHVELQSKQTEFADIQRNQIHKRWLST